MKNIVIIGIGRFGSIIAKKASETGHEILAIDQDETRVQEISNYVTYTVQANFTDKKTLETLGINKFDIGIVGIGKNLYDNIAAAFILKRFNIPYIIARANNELHGSILKELGINEVVYPEQSMGLKVVEKL